MSRIDGREIDYWNRMDTLLRQERHDFLNVLQILSGYIQLGNDEKALQYIKKISSQSQQFTTIFNLKCLDLCFLLLERYKYYMIEQIMITYKVESMIEVEDYKEIDRQGLEQGLIQVKQFIDDSISTLASGGNYEVTISIKEEKKRWMVSAYTRNNIIGNCCVEIGEKTNFFLHTR